MANEVFRLVGRVLVDTSDAEKGIESTEKKGSRLGAALSGMGKAAAATMAIMGTLTAAVVAFGGSSVQAATGFEQGIANVKTLLTGTAAEVNATAATYGEAVKKLMVDTGQSAETLQGGLYEVISTFGEGGDSIAQLTTATKAAAASGATAADSIKLLGAVTKGYGDTSKEATQKAADLAFQTANLGVTTFPELAASMGAVIPLASTMKVSQEELFGAMATLTGVTGNTAEVTTQLRGTIQAFLQPTDAMAEAMKKAGYANGQAMIQAEGLGGALNILKEGVKGNEIAFSNLFGSVEAKGAVLALTGTQADAFAEKTKAMGSAAGSANKAFATTQETTQSMMNRLNAGIEVMKINIGQSLLPIVMNVMQTVQANMPAVSTLLQGFFSQLGAAVTGILPSLIQVGQQLLPIITDIVTQFITTILPMLAAAIVALLPVVGKIITDVLPLLIQLANMLIPPIIQIITDLLPVLIDMATTLLAPMIDLVRQILPPLLQLAKQLIPPIQSILSTLVPAVSQIISALIPPITKILNMLLPPLLGLVNLFVPLFQQFIAALLPPIIKLINQVIPIVTQLLQLILPPLLQIITNLITPMMEIITAVLPILIDLATSLLVPLGDMLVQVLPPLLDVIGQLLVPLGSLLKTLLPPLISLLGTLAGTQLKQVISAFTAVANIITSVVLEAFNAMKPVIEPAMKFIADLIQLVTDAISGNWSKVWGDLKRVFVDMWNGMKAAAKAPINGIIGIINGFIKGLNKLKIPDWIPGVGGKGIHIPLIPYLASGGDIQGAGGWYRVGEKGWEDVYLPGGSKVVPLKERDRKAGTGGSVTVNQNFYTDRVSEYKLRREGERLAQQLAPA